MKNTIINAFWSSLVLSIVVSLTTYILPRFVFKGYYTANLVNGIKIGLLGFLLTFVISFFAFLIYGFWTSRKAKKEHELKRRKRRH